MRNHLRLLAMMLCTAVASLPIEASTANTSTANGDVSVTPTSGESWLNHLHRSFGDTSMGKTGRLGPPASEDGSMPAGWQLGLLPAPAAVTTLRGADLYRLNCEGCHGESGMGAPPEINSVINPVRATSISLVIERMKKTGMEISPSAAVELAKQSQAALLQRLHNGGESMPPFRHLNDAEVRSLVAYLKQLAGVPDAAQLTVTESPLRVGEHIVKSTCHTCHDATGPNPSPQQLENGTIPPLETLTTRVDEVQLIRKVTSGAPILMGTPPTLHRGRMPVFYYLSQEEAADVYLYLTTYPPEQLQQASALPAAEVQQGGAGRGAPPVKPSATTPPANVAQKINPPNRSGIPDWVVTVVLIGLGSALMALVAGGLAYAAYELHRLGQASQQKADRTGVVSAQKRESADLVLR